MCEDSVKMEGSSVSGRSFGLFCGADGMTVGKASPSVECNCCGFWRGRERTESGSSMDA